MADYRSELTISRGGPADEPEQVSYEVFSLKKLGERVPESLRSLPISLKVLLENLLRWDDGSERSRTDIESLLRWDPQARPTQEIAFTPARVLLQDFTGVPCVVDLAAMREAVAKLGGDAKRINPLQPVDLVIDHSVQVDSFGSAVAFRTNAELEFSRNRERYEFLRWGSKAFGNFSVVPPDTGIVHQVNLEYLARVVFASQTAEGTVAYPDSVVGTDSHTPMVNALGVVGWGVGGIEAEAAMLGQPISMLVPQVVGFQLTGKLQPGATATDLVLTVTQILREHGVVGRFVEFFGAGVAALSVADRATIANMCPEYGATIGFFPVDNETLNYLRLTGRSEARIALIEAYCREQGMFVTPESPAPRFTETVTLDLSTVEPSLAGPKRPQDRIPLHASKLSYRQALVNFWKPTTGRYRSQPSRNGSAGMGTQPWGRRCNSRPISWSHSLPIGWRHQRPIGRWPGQARSRDLAGWPKFRVGARRGRDRRDHQLHEYLQPFGDAGGRTAGAEGCGEGSFGQTLGQDQPRAGIESRDRLLQSFGADAVSRKDRVLYGWLWLHHVHRQQQASAGTYCGGHHGG